MKVPDLSQFLTAVKNVEPVSVCGQVKRVVGLVVEAQGPNVSVGGLCEIEVSNGQNILAEVVGFKDERVLLIPFGDPRGIEPGSKVYWRRESGVRVGEALLGRVIDALGKPLDGRKLPPLEDVYPIHAEPLKPFERARIEEPLDVGVRAINALLTVGKGQRIAIMAGSGVGKSTLLGMMARHTKADVNVIALIGERGREVREFLERDLGEDGLKRSVVVVATSDQPPPLRLRGAYLAMAVAEFFRDKGADVLLMMDSLTRFCMAGREVGLAIGEPPTARGYTPSVFAALPRLLERPGPSARGGSITGIFTVLVEGDDFNEPVADAVRSIVDGHICLTRELAHQGHYPAIDILQSISRVMKDIVSQEQIEAAKELVNILAIYRKAEDLINIGAYVKGSNPQIDRALNKIEVINSFLRQNIDEKADFETSVKRLIEVVK
ncbi:ATPase, FliI/YscN family [Thermodesulfatator indicus DSM 15286]|uniref:ATPase, FliI/YscN family n=1 Tax=Thermodesulfatator indicus (strain DSM 15286 / JCM 11887 / CIR29812) TaxID=667014 RepID=F8ABX8_THEID|nr:FliI/YscN family ATPase [Thermodesulfatator indicus]AEH45670.1 ATPase, FliI/YscN family [Thermodesulfatator indicus DSM 15286]